LKRVCKLFHKPTICTSTLRSPWGSRRVNGLISLRLRLRPSLWLVRAYGSERGASAPEGEPLARREQACRSVKSIWATACVDTTPMPYNSSIYIILSKTHLQFNDFEPNITWTQYNIDTFLPHTYNSSIYRINLKNNARWKNE
jgi:hypothetical protein